MPAATIGLSIEPLPDINPTTFNFIANANCSTLLTGSKSDW
jgi:hypothetical protein